MDQDLFKQAMRMLYERRARYDQPIWYIYMVTNESRKEVYFGVAIDPQDRFSEHADGDTKRILHWDFENEILKYFLVAGPMPQPGASRRAHEMEDLYEILYPEYRVLKTAGI